MTAALVPVSAHSALTSETTKATTLQLIGAAAILGFVTSLWAGYHYGPTGEDSNDYQLLAHNLVEGHGLSLAHQAPYEPSASRSPVFPVFLAGVYWMVGQSREH